MTRPAEPPRALVPVLLFLGMVAAVISSLGAPLIPSIARAHDVSLSYAQWSLTITLLVGAIATPVIGRLGDGPHRRGVVLVVLALVTLGGALSALPVSIELLLAGRGLQGLGLGIAPVAIATARSVLVGERARSTAAALSVTVVAGVGLGYPLTGLIAEVGGVHAAFWFGAAVAALAFAAAWITFPPSTDVPGRPLDVPGALLLGLGLAAALLVISQGGVWGWSSGRLVLLAGVSVLALVAWAGWQLRAATPLVDLRLARGRTAATAHAGALLIGTANYLLMASVARFVQTPEEAGYGFDTTVVVAGLILVPFSVGGIAAGRLNRVLERKAGPRLLLPMGALVVGLGLASFGVARGTLWQLLLVMFVAGLGAGLTFAALPGLIVAAVPPGETGSAMSLNQVLRYVGFSVGSALSGAVLEAATPEGSGLPTDVGYTWVVIVGVALCAATAMLTWLLPARTPRPAVDEDQHQGASRMDAPGPAGQSAGR